ncbi:MAG: tyrosine--tRNA ligase [Erysipelotrichaceae bacterium]
MNFLEELQWRGLIKDVTDMEGLKERIKQPMTLYCGFDPTADSLHIGNLQQIILLKRYQMQGHTPIALCGAATGMIGDPRPTSERRLISLEEVRNNAVLIEKQLSLFLSKEGKNAFIAVNNYDWLSQINILDFLRDYGKYFNINYMIAKDTIASRLDTGISFTEFTYTILQAADWLHLYDTYHCDMQIGGSDQWGNLTSGTELIRKKHGENAKVFGVTSPLITNTDGSKFGKSEGKNIWLDAKRTDPYHFYQFWLNVADADIIDFMKRLSFMRVEEIETMALSVAAEPHLRLAQRALAEELTLLVHGPEGLAAALRITEVLFSGEWRKLEVEELRLALADAPQHTITEDSLLVDLLANTKIASSKREARELVQNGSISVNGVKMTSIEDVVRKEDAIGNQLTVIRKGKKNYFVIEHSEESK